MTLPGTDPESYITEYTLVYEENIDGGVHNLSEADEGHWDGGDSATGTDLEATQGQMNGFLSQLPYKCHLEEVASVGD